MVSNLMLLCIQTWVSTAQVDFLLLSEVCDTNSFSLEVILFITNQRACPRKLLERADIELGPIIPRATTLTSRPWLLSLYFVISYSYTK